jgi:cytochrome c5
MNHVFVVFVVLACSSAAAVVSATGQDVTLVERGERILNRSCTTCHDLRPIQVQALDPVGWTKTIKAEIEKGAKIEAGDMPVLVDYLATHHGPLPDGAGKSILLNTCTLCHDLRRVREHSASAESWEETLVAMLNEGAMLSDQDFPVLLRYLARNFGPER